MIDPTAWPDSPSPATIRSARESAGLTQRQAGALIYARERTWMSWERAESPMHPAFWELWQMRVRDAAWLERVRTAA